MQLIRTIKKAGTITVNGEDHTLYEYDDVSINVPQIISTWTLPVGFIRSPGDMSMRGGKEAYIEVNRTEVLMSNGDTFAVLSHELNNY